MNQQLLSSIADKLNKNGTNYCVFLQTYTVPINANSSAKEYIRQAASNTANIGNIHAVRSDEVIREVESALTFTGYDGAGPASVTLQSAAFAVQLAELLSGLKAMAAKASKVERFWFQDGHPAYPVFWDFAFMFTFQKGVVIFIGSSSD
jgi:hypothetical protein